MRFMEDFISFSNDNSTLVNVDVWRWRSLVDFVRTKIKMRDYWVNKKMKRWLVLFLLLLNVVEDFVTVVDCWLSLISDCWVCWWLDDVEPFRSLILLRRFGFSSCPLFVLISWSIWLVNKLISSVVVELFVVAFDVSWNSFGLDSITFNKDSDVFIVESKNQTTVNAISEGL